jgi:hypothetical protein
MTVSAAVATRVRATRRLYARQAVTSTERRLPIGDVTTMARGRRFARPGSSFAYGSMTKTQQIVVVGSGISGLTTAISLLDAGTRSGGGREAQCGDDLGAGGGGVVSDACRTVERVLSWGEDTFRVLPTKRRRRCRRRDARVAWAVPPAPG